MNKERLQEWRLLLSPGHWPLLRERGLLREWLGLHRWLALPAADRQRDDRHGIQQAASAVLDSETGAGDDALATMPVIARLRAIRAHLRHGAPLAVADPEVLQTLRRERRQLRKQLVADSKLLQLPFDQIRDAVPWLTAFFLASGYLMVSYYLGHFGIRVSRFFTLWDYLSSSIDALRGLVISFLISGGAMVLAFRLTKLRLLQRALAVHRGLHLLNWLILLLGCGLLLWLARIQSDLLSVALLFTALHAVAFITPSFSSYLRKPQRAMFVASFLVIYSTVIVNVITGSIRHASQPFQDGDTLYQVRYGDGKAEGRYRLLAGNPQWLFLQDEQLKLHAVSVQQIQSLELLPAIAEGDGN